LDNEKHVHGVLGNFDTKFVKKEGGGGTRTVEPASNAAITGEWDVFIPGIWRVYYAEYSEGERRHARSGTERLRQYGTV